MMLRNSAPKLCAINYINTILEANLEMHNVQQRSTLLFSPLSASILHQELVAPTHVPIRRSVVRTNLSQFTQSEVRCCSITDSIKTKAFTWTQGSIISCRNPQLVLRNKAIWYSNVERPQENQSCNEHRKHRAT